MEYYKKYVTKNINDITYVSELTQRLLHFSIVKELFIKLTEYKKGAGLNSHSGL